MSRRSLLLTAVAVCALTVSGGGYVVYRQHQAAEAERAADHESWYGYTIGMRWQDTPGFAANPGGYGYLARNLADPWYEANLSYDDGGRLIRLELRENSREAGACDPGPCEMPRRKSDAQVQGEAETVRNDLLRRLGPPSWQRAVEPASREIGWSFVRQTDCSGTPPPTREDPTTSLDRVIFDEGADGFRLDVRARGWEHPYVPPQPSNVLPSPSPPKGPPPACPPAS